MFVLGTVRGDGAIDFDQATTAAALGNDAYQVDRILQFDPDILSGATFCVGTISKAAVDTANNSELNPNDFITITPTGTMGDQSNQFIRRLTRFDDVNANDDRLLITLISPAGTRTAVNLSAALGHKPRL